MQSIEDTSLDYLFVGGEKLGEFQSPANYQAVDEYGPTEANNFVSSINNSKKIELETEDVALTNDTNIQNDEELNKQTIEAIEALKKLQV